ncbi:hypothetical protein T552_00663 [Pneumocystis carinii B80]|uniref:C2H2-type domain-containing protein n=1 Tax=Pneumocystis carinii (strain B80) TaxID=1408658 RepID=A0A0W4ZPA5_PNEC8|nr:hypothetical protein T552_00663 [Pneumocystis carinii B80]KTW30184.1 hypothetical protein T552_00663 [Pneumocystis carinii B80]
MQSPEIRRERVSIDGSYVSWKHGNFLPNSLQGQSFLGSGGNSMETEEGLGCEEYLCPRLEISFCKDFNCCGVVLRDLHDLCRHYEEAHVRLEEEGLFVSSGARFANSAFACRMGWDGKPRLDLYESSNGDMDLDQEFAFDHLFQSLSESDKQEQNLAPLSVSTRDFLLSSSNISTPSSSMPSTPTFDSSQEFLVLDMDDTETVVLNGSSLLAEEWVKQQMVKKQRQHGVTLSDAESRATIDSPGSNFVVVDKPYKCPVMGCDKAYKNQNGLKYHKLHGHCTASVMLQDTTVPVAFSDEAVVSSPKGNPVVENKPYKCELCNKRYKNLNGLKYHKAHSHQQISMAQIQREVLMQGW